MKVYSVEEIVDLGNHVVRMFSSRGMAEELCKELNEDAQEKLMKDQMYFEVNEYEVEEIRVSLKEFKKVGKKDLWDFVGVVHYETAFGTQKTSIRNVVESLRHVDPIEFVVAFDKMQEDWDFTENLGKYCVELTVNLLSEPSEHEEDKKWKEEYKAWLKQQLAKLEDN